MSSSSINDYHVDVINDILDSTQVSVNAKDKINSSGGCGVLSLLYSVDIVDGIELKHSVQYLVYSILIEMIKIERGTFALFSDDNVFQELVGHVLKFALPDISIPIVCKGLLNFEVELYSNFCVKQIDLKEYLKIIRYTFSEYLDGDNEISFVQSKLRGLDFNKNYADLNVDSQIFKTIMDSFIELKLIFGNSIRNNFNNAHKKTSPFESKMNSDIPEEPILIENIDPIIKKEPLNIIDYLKSDFDLENSNVLNFFKSLNLEWPNKLPNFTHELTLTNSNLLYYILACFTTNYDLHFKY